ncbi:MAG: FG-GAP-like repeat-containing protein [Vicinamibacterales bacterium]|nr:FG-GAP-like repeat-containing protein [Vicinamibacterales bacterium]
MMRIGSPAHRLSITALVLVALGLPARSLAQAPTFSALVTSGTGSGTAFPEAAAVGDFNGDGNLDALVTDGTTSLRLMLGHGNGTFTKHDVSAPGTNPGPIRAAHLNGDARLDAVLTSNGPGNATVLINTGNDTNGVPQFTLTTYAGGGRSVTVGDLNGDGYPDFITGDAWGTLRVHVNDGTGTFAAGQVTNIVPNTGGPSVGRGVIADLNGDGRADFVVTSTQSGRTNIFFGNGDGTLQTTPVQIPVHAFDVAVADLNHDGTPDLIQAAGGPLLVHLNSGDGTFSAPPAEYTLGGGSVTTADINGDGHLDVVVGHNVVRLGDGTGALGTEHLFLTNDNARDVAVADFNGDGKPDIGTVGRDARRYSVFLNTTVFAPPVVTVFASGTAAVTTWDPIFPASAFHPWQSQCSAVPAVGPNANWVNPHAAFAFPLGSHPWEDDAPYDFAAHWINAWSDLNSRGPSGQNWTKYSTTVTGAGDFVLQFLADNCSWIYLNDQLIGVQDDNWSINGTGRYTISLTGAGPHELSFIIWDGGGLAGGKFRLETVQSFQDNNPGEDLPPPPPSDTTPPVIGALTDLVAEATQPGGAFVAFTVTAEDDVDGTVDPVAAPASNSLFPIGSTTVTVTATDSAGNSSQDTFTVTVEDTTPPVITSISGNLIAEATSAAGAIVTYDPATATDAVGVVSITYSTESGATFPIGTTTVTVTASDAAGNASSASFTVTVQDTTAPAIGDVTPSQATIWPPNHRMVAINVNAVASDVVGVTSLKIISVTSSEPDNGLGDGDTVGDIVITGPLSVDLRAERSGSGNGRTYTITVEARDAAGNASTKTCTVFVPKSQGRR